MPTRSLRPRLEPLEDRVTPAYSATFAGFTSTWTGNSSGGVGDVVIFTRDSGTGNLIHNRFVAGDAGFNSAQDFDTTVAGDQTLGANAASTVAVTTGGSGLEQVIIGGSVGAQTAAASQLLAVFVVTAGAAGQQVLIDDALSTTGTTYTGTVAGAVSGFLVGSTSVSVTGGVPGLTTLNTSSGGDTVSIAGTRGPTTVNTNAGADTVRVTGTAAGQTLTLDTGAGFDNVTLGSLAGFTNPGLLTPIAGPVVLDGGGDDAQLFVDDGGEGGAADYTITSTAVTRSSPTGFGGVTYANLASVNLFTGTGANVIRVLSTATGVTTNIAAGDGDDTIEMGNGADLNGGSVNGQGGADTITYAGATTPVAVNLGLGVTGLTAALDGGQENPGTDSPATGTATLSNYDVTNKTFDLVVTVTGVAPTEVTGFHFHRGGVGVNGPVVLDLLGLAPLVPTGTGFTFTLNNLILGAFAGGVANEAALLGGQLYLNIHTASAPGGLIRGQIFASANVNLANGTATRTGGVTAVENATGGTLDDSLVGSFGANTLRGQGGGDTILGGPGADTFSGESGNDVMIWSNGDGSDVMDGSTGTDTVAVNGSLTANDVFTIGANGSRVAFTRVSPGPFTLDVGTVESLQVNGIVGDDSFTLNSLAGVADLTAVGLNGLAGNDTFTVTPFAGTTAVRGGVGQDTLTATTAGTTNPFVTTAADPAGGRFGGFAFGNRGPVNFTQTENPSAPANFVTVTVTDGLTTAITGTSILYTLTVTNSSALGVNGISVTDVLPAALTGVTWAAVFTAGSTGTPGGSGNINQQVNLAAGGSVTYSIVATISPAFAGSLTNTASAAVPAGLTDDTPADDTATDTTTVTLPPVPPPPPLPPVGVDLFAAATGPGVPVQVNVFNANGTLRFALTPFGGFAGGASVATGDVTGDGIDDIAVGAGAGGGPHVKVFDGASGAEIQSFFAYDVGFHGGVFVGVGDTSADGRADVVMGAGAGGGPHVKVFDGRTWTERMSFFAYDPGFAGGVSVRAGDTNADGFADVVTGAGPGGGPHVRVVSGKDGSELQSFFAGDPTSTGGVFVGIGNFRPATALPEIVSSVNGVVRVFGSSAAGRPYIEQDSFVAFASGVKAVPAAVRLDDGIIAILIGAVGEVAPHVKIIDGTSSTLRSSFFAFDPAFLGGAFVG